MATGLQCWDANGVEVFSTESRTLRYVGSTQGNLNSWRGRIADSRITRNSILAGRMVNVNGQTTPVSLSASDGAFYFFALLGGTVYVDIYEY